VATEYDSLSEDGMSSQLAWRGVAATYTASLGGSGVSTQAMLGPISVRQYEEPSGRISRQALRVTIPRTTGAANGGNAVANPAVRDTLTLPTGPSNASETWTVLAIVSKQAVFAVLECVREKAETKTSPNAYIRRTA
jgi:hypothetical protein